MTNDGFLYDSGRILFRQNGYEFSPHTIPGVVSVNVGNNGHGCRLGFTNGASMSIQWHENSYCSNRFMNLEKDRSYSPDAEVSIFLPSGEWYSFGGDTLAGWQSIHGVMAYIREFSSPIAAVA